MAPFQYKATTDQAADTPSFFFEEVAIEAGDHEAVTGEKCGDIEILKRFSVI